VCAVVLLITDSTLKDQAAVTGRLLAVMESQQRAWINYQHRPPDRLIRATTGLDYDQAGGISFQIYFPYENIGHLPAKAVTLVPHVILESRPNFMAEQAKFVRDLIGLKGPPALGKGRYLFPGDDGAFLETLSISKEDVAAKQTKPNGSSRHLLRSAFSTSLWKMTNYLTSLVSLLKYIEKAA
jgi:hypothetical protein